MLVGGSRAVVSRNSSVNECGCDAHCHILLLYSWSYPSRFDRYEVVVTLKDKIIDDLEGDQ